MALLTFYLILLVHWTIKWECQGCWHLFLFLFIYSFSFVGLGLDNLSVMLETLGVMSGAPNVLFGRPDVHLNTS